MQQMYGGAMPGSNRKAVKCQMSEVKCNGGQAKWQAKMAVFFLS
jgi:hypothetical protein